MLTFTLLAALAIPATPSDLPIEASVRAPGATVVFDDNHYIEVVAFVPADAALTHTADDEREVRLLAAAWLRDELVWRGLSEADANATVRQAEVVDTVYYGVGTSTERRSDGIAVVLGVFLPDTAR